MFIELLKHPIQSPENMIREHLLYVGLFQSIFAAFVLGTKRNITISDIILVLCLISIAARFFAKIYFNQATVYDHSDFSVGIIPLTFGPFLYLYTKYLTRENPPFQRSDLLHFLPFAIFIFLSLTFFRERHLIIGEDTFFERDTYLWVRIVFGIACFTSVLLYTIFTYNKLFAYRKNHQGKSELSRTGHHFLMVGFCFNSIHPAFYVLFCFGNDQCIDFFTENRSCIYFINRTNYTCICG